jgi:predicted small lipoprotein YifL
MLALEKAGLERVLTPVRWPIRVALTVAGLAALALAACGRVGPLELPPGPAAAPAPSAQLKSSDGTPVPGSPEDTALKTGFDSQGNPVSPRGPKRSFVLDPLLQ